MIRAMFLSAVFCLAAASAGNPDEDGASKVPVEGTAQIEQLLQADRGRLAEIKAELAGPSGESRQAVAEFTQIDAELDKATRDLASFEQAGQAAEAEKQRALIARLTPNWELAKARFDLAIQKRKTLAEQIAVLEQTIAEHESALEAVRTGAGEKAADGPSSAASATAAPVPDAVPAAASGPSSPAAAAPPPAVPGLSALPRASVLPQPAWPPPVSREQPSEELVQAAKEARQKETAARSAEEAARSLTARTGSLEREIELERRLRDNAQKLADNADEMLRKLVVEVNQKESSGADAESLKELRGQMASALSRLSENRTQSRLRSNRLDELQSELAGLQSQRITALTLAEKKRLEAEAARRKVENLQNPFAPRNIAQWLLKHGLTILAILLAMGMFVWISKLFEARLVDLVSRRGVRGTKEERENRAKTLVGVFHNAASILTIGGGILMILDEVGMPVGPLMGGAAVVGLAVAFGAQSLIKDYFYGFMVLLEQQYLVNDVVRIGEIAGQVERITMRMTVLRDLEGRVHFISHGQITTVTNMTHGWSRALFDIGVSYKEDVNRVMAVLVELRMQMRRDPVFGPLILEDPTMLGVDAFGDSAVVIKFFIKTRPLKQWMVKRELLRRIKTTFDEQGIEIPFPHRIVYHRHSTLGEGGDNSPIPFGGQQVA